MGGRKHRGRGAGGGDSAMPQPKPPVQRRTQSPGSERTSSAPVLWVVGDGRQDRDYLRQSAEGVSASVKCGAASAFDVRVSLDLGAAAEFRGLSAADTGADAAARVAHAWRPGDVVAVLVPAGAEPVRFVEWLQPLLDRIDGLPDEVQLGGDWFRAVALLRRSATKGSDAAALAERLRARPMAVSDVSSLALTRDDCKRALDAALLDRTRIVPLYPLPAPATGTPIED